MPASKIAYVDASEAIYVSTPVLLDDECDYTRVMEALQKPADDCVGDPVALVSEIVGRFTSDPDAGVDEVWLADDTNAFIFYNGHYFAQWRGADVVLVRNDSGREFSAMSYSGRTERVLPGTITVWKRGELIKCVPIATGLDISEQAMQYIKECAAGDAPILDKMIIAYQAGYRDAVVANEVERFGRIWTDECQAVNGGNIAPIISLFLSTVADQNRNMVHQAILQRYRK